MTLEPRIRVDVCTDCTRPFPATTLFRCGRSLGDGYVEIRLCIDCLYAVNPFLQRDLIESAFNVDDEPPASTNHITRGEN